MEGNVKKSRRQRQEEGARFVKDVEASLTRIIDIEARKKGSTWDDLFNVLNERIKPMERAYPRYKGKVLVAVNNVRRVLVDLHKQETMAK